MNKVNFKKLVVDCFKEQQLKNALRRLVVESIEEIKAEKKMTISQMMRELEDDVQKINKDLSVVKDDAGCYNINGSHPHTFKLNNMHGDVFDLTYFRDGSDREKKVGISFADLKSYVKDKLSSKELNYQGGAFNKSAKHTKPETGKEEGTIKPRVKAEDAVTKKEDLPDAPYRDVGTIKRQSDGTLKGTKPDYTFPKQKNNKLTIKQKSKKVKGLPKSK
jgi:hypothetical protein